MIKLAATLLILTTPFCAHGQDASAVAKITLVAPSNVRVGELVRLEVSGGKSYMWKLVPGLPGDIEVYAQGTKCVFSAQSPGRYQIIVAAATGDTVDVVYAFIEVRGPPQEPADDSLASWIPYWMWTIQLPRDEAALLAASFESVATRKGELKTPADWINATRESNKEALGTKLEHWAPFLDKIGAVLLKRAKAGTLTTPEQHAALWLEIAEGLRNGS